MTISEAPPVVTPARGSLRWRILLIALAHLPLIAIQALRCWQRPYERYAPFALLAALVLVRRDAARLGPLEPGDRRLATSLLAGAWAMLAVACVLASYWLGAVAALGASAAAAYAAGGSRLVRALWPAWAFLVMAIPLPLGLDSAVMVGLQSGTTRCASLVLDMMGVYHVQQGGTFLLVDRRLAPAFPSSSMHSLFAVVVFTAFLVVWRRRPTIWVLTLVEVAVVWVVLCDILRAVAMTALAARRHIDTGSGWRREALGLAAVALSLGLILSTDRLFRLLADTYRLLAVGPGRPSPRPWRLPEVPGASRRIFRGLSASRGFLSGSAREPDDPSTTRLPDPRRTALASWGLTAAYGVLLAAQPFLLRTFVADEVLRPKMPGWFAALKADDLPASYEGGFRRQAMTTKWPPRGAMGAFSDRWVYRWESRRVTISLDGPFRGWYDPTAQYELLNWTAGAWSLPPAEPAKPDTLTVQLERPGRQAELFVSGFDDRGRTVPPREVAGRLVLVNLLFERIDALTQPRGYQIRMLVEGATAMSASEREQALAFFRGACALIHEHGPGGGRVAR
jgi:hypothetical protein